MTRTIVKTSIAVIVAYSILFISCNEARNNDNQLTNYEKKLIEIDSAIKKEMALNDTADLYKLKNSEANKSVARMSKLIFEMEQAMYNDRPEFMPEIMGELNDIQRHQNVLQSKLSKTDRALYKTLMKNMANKILVLGNIMSDMVNNQKNKKN